MDVLKIQGGEHQLSYLCKICSKRFVSGKALGGHMRTHAPVSITADTFTEIEFRKSKGSGDWDHKLMQEKEMDEVALDNNGSNLMYDLRRNPKHNWGFEDRDYSFLLGHRFDSKPIESSINCDLCGKEFSSWEGLFGHMKCNSETHQDSGDSHIEESQKHETQDQDEEGSESDVAIETEIDHPNGNSSRFDEWMKGKRSKRPRYAIQLNNPHKQSALDPSNEEEDMAKCLVMLASGVNTATDPHAQVAEDPVSGDLKLHNTGFQLPKCISKEPKSEKIDGDVVLYDDHDVKKARYRCTTCNKGFQSYQALGGHRTGHKNVKSSFSQIEDQSESLQEDITDEELIHGSDSELPGNLCIPHPKKRTKDSCVRARDETRTMEVAAFSRKKTPRVHECSICHRVFSSGQALGGHKRRHWTGAGAFDTVSTISSNKDTPMQQQQMPARVELLDLNLPAPADDDSYAGKLNNLGGNAPDSNGISNAQTQSPPYMRPWLRSIYPKQGLFLYNSHINFSKDDETDSKTGKEIGFGKGCDSDFPVKAQPWLQL